MSKSVPSRMTRFIYALIRRYGHWLVLLLGHLSRLEIQDESEGRWQQSSLIATWHGRFLLPLYFMRRRRVLTLVSQHADGEMIAAVVKHLGYEAVRGSSTRGGKEAFHGMLTALRQGRTGAIQPDGPTGPHHRVKKGVVLLAQQAKVPIIPMTFAAKHGHHFASWDRFAIWYPFSRTCLFIGAPVDLPAEMTLNEGMSRVESEMMELETRADHYYA